EVVAVHDAIARAQAAAEIGMGVVDAGIEEGDRVAGASIRVRALHGIQADDGTKIGGRREPVLEQLQAWLMLEHRSARDGRLTAEPGPQGTKYPFHRCNS